MVKNYKLFTFFLILSFFVVNLFYIYFFDRIVYKKKEISYIYREFLLEKTKTPRLIIESGSNSLYGIDSKMLEDRFNILTINISDNAGFPLKYKLLKIEKYAKKGDIILLPLEWQYYSRTKGTKEFYDFFFKYSPSYYEVLSNYEKLNLIYHTPFSSLRQNISISNLFDNERYKYHKEYHKLKDYMLIFNDGKRGDVEYKLPKKSLNDNKICSSYIFEEQLKNGFKISQRFKDNMKYLKKLEKKGIKFLITCPVVVGKGCYEGDHGKYFKILFKDIKEYFKKNNINFIGNFTDSSFEKRYFLNTYYHILREAKKIRTERFIKRIENSPYIDWFKNKKQIVDFKPLFHSMQERYIFFHNRLKYGQKVFFNTNFKDEVILNSNWYEIENWGRWSKGDSSKIFFSVDDSKKPLIIELKATIFKKDQNQTQININGKKLGIYNLNGTNKIIIPNNFIKKNIVEMEFKHLNHKLPIDYGVTDENRSLKLGLKSLIIKSN